MHHPIGGDNRPSLGGTGETQKTPLRACRGQRESKVHFGKSTLWMVEARENIHEAKISVHMYEKTKGKKPGRDREKQNPGVLIPSNQESLAQETSFTNISSC